MQPTKAIFVEKLPSPGFQEKSQPVPAAGASGCSYQSEGRQGNRNHIAFLNRENLIKRIS